MAKRAVVDRGQLWGMCAWYYWPFLPRILSVVSQIREIWVDNNNHKMVPISANLCSLEANLVSNCRKKNSLNAHTTCLVIK